MLVRSDLLPILAFWVVFDGVLIDRYIHFYNHERIQNKTGVAPLTLRHSA